MECIKLDKTAEWSAYLCLMEDVENMKDTRKALIAGNLNAALLKPTMIVDTFTVLQAAHRAVRSEKLKTKSVYTEILYNLSPTSKISESLITFGVSDQDKAVLIVHLSKGDDSEIKAICETIQGKIVSLDKLKTFTDEVSVLQLYKIGTEELSVATLTEAIINRISTKDYL